MLLKGSPAISGGVEITDVHPCPGYFNGKSPFTSANGTALRHDTAHKGDHHVIEPHKKNP
jgi:hypothetical protein